MRNGDAVQSAMEAYRHLLAMRDELHGAMIRLVEEGSNDASAPEREQIIDCLEAMAYEWCTKSTHDFIDFMRAPE
jgi:hypothetical protein